MSPLPKKAVPSKPSKETQKPESKHTDSLQSELPMVTESPLFFPPLTELTQVVGREISSELSELDDPEPKQKAKTVNKVRSDQLFPYYV